MSAQIGAAVASVKQRLVNFTESFSRASKDLASVPPDCCYKPVLRALATMVPRIPATARRFIRINAAHNQTRSREETRP